MKDNMPPVSSRINVSTLKKVYEDSTLGYSQEESFDIDYKMIQQEVDTIMNINFPTAPVVNPETVVEEDDVESYFD